MSLRARESLLKQKTLQTKEKKLKEPKINFL